MEKKKVRKIERSNDIPKKGRPSIDDYTEPDQLPERIREFCRFLVKGYTPFEAGASISPPVGRQQVERYRKNVAVRKYIDELWDKMPEERKVEEVKQIRDLDHELIVKVYNSLGRKADKDEIGVKDMQYLIQRKELSMGIVDPVSAPSGQAITYKEVSIKNMMDSVSKDTKGIEDNSPFVKKKIVDV